MGVMGFPAVKIPEPLRRILRYVKSWTIKQSRCQFWDVFYKIIRIEVGGCQNPAMVGTKNNAFLWREPYQSSLCTATLFRQDPNHKSPKRNKQSQDHLQEFLRHALCFLVFFGIPKFEAPHLPGFFGQIHDPIFLLDSMGMGSRLTMSYHIESVSWPGGPGCGV